MKRDSNPFVDILAHGGTRQEVLRSLVTTLVEVSRADYGVYFSVGVDAEAIPRFVDVNAVGTERAVEVLTSVEGVSYASLASSADTVRNAPSVGRFDRVRRSEIDGELPKFFWDPLSIHQGMAMNSQSEDGRFLGQVALFRSGRSPEFSDRDHARVQRLRPQIQAALTAVAPWHDTEPPSATVLLFGPEGELRMQQGSCAAWERSSFREEVQGLVDLALSEEATVIDRFVEDAMIRVTLLEGEELGVLVVARGVKPLVLDRLLCLSRATREVVAIACRGATVAEMAERLHRSPDTVRSHLKQAYAELGIGSRAELVALVERAMSDPTNG